MYKLIKTTQKNVIIREENKRKIYVLKGTNFELLGGKKLDDWQQCWWLSHKLEPTKTVRGSLKRAVEIAKRIVVE